MPAWMGGRGGTSAGFGADRRGHGLVPGGRLGGVGDADDLAQLHGELDAGAHLGPAFGLVGVEQLIGGPAGEHQVELPGQVGGVPDTGAHALPGEGRHLVGGVTGQEDPAGPPALGEAGVEGVHGVALQLGVVGVHVPRARAAPRPGRPS